MVHNRYRLYHTLRYWLWIEPVKGHFKWQVIVFKTPAKALLKIPVLKKIFFLSRILMVGMSKKHRIMFVLFNFIHLYFATTKLYLYLVFSSLLKNFPVSHLYCVSLETRYSLLNVITASLINLHFRSWLRFLPSQGGFYSLSVQFIWLIRSHIGATVTEF